MIATDSGLCKKVHDRKTHADTCRRMYSDLIHIPVPETRKQEARGERARLMRQSNGSMEGRKENGEQDFTEHWEWELDQDWEALLHP
jgi:hypothetical protein